MKVVYNGCYGGFGLSEEAEAILRSRGVVFYWHWDIERHNPELVKVVEELGKEAGGEYSSLLIEEIPDGAEYEIDEYDGLESVVPPRMSW